MRLGRPIILIIFVCFILHVKGFAQITLPDSSDSNKNSRTLLKAAAAVGIAVFAVAYQDELREFDTKYDRIAHVTLGYTMTKLFGWKFATGFIFAIELTQIDIYGIEGRGKDTALDIFSGGVGIGIAIKL